MKYKIVNRFRFISFITISIILICCIFAGLFNTTIALNNKKENFTEVLVCEGDTLWDIAKEYGTKTKDVREVIYDICKTNGLSGAEIYEGQLIRVPEK